MNNRLNIYAMRNLSVPDISYTIRISEECRTISNFTTQNLKEQKSINLCDPCKHDLRCASLCGVEFLFTWESREKQGAAEVMFKRVTVIIRSDCLPLYVLLL